MHASLTHSFYKMNFPRKNPMKMAAITTRSDGRELEPLSLRAKAVGDPDLSECATFLSLKPSSWRGEKNKNTDGRKLWRHLLYNYIKPNSKAKSTGEHFNKENNLKNNIISYQKPGSEHSKPEHFE